MSLKNNKAPQKAFSKLTEWLSRRNGDQSLTIQNEFENSTPHQVYYAELEDILKNKNLENAYPVAWRFIFPDQTDENMRLSAFEIRGQNEDEYFFNQVNYGELVEEEKAIVQLGKENLQFNGFEYAFLRLVELRIKAAWFRSTTRDQDWFYPLSPSFNELEAGRGYRSEEFLPLLISAAEMALTIWPPAMEGKDGEDQPYDDMLGG